MPLTHNRCVPSFWGCVALLWLWSCAEPSIGKNGEPDHQAHGAQPNGLSGKSLVDTSAGLAILGEFVFVRSEGFSRSEIEAALRVGEGTSRLLWLSSSTRHALIRVGTDEDVGPLQSRLGATEVVRHRVMEGTGIGTTPSVTMQWNIPAMGFELDGDLGRADGVVIALLDSGISRTSTSDLADVTLQDGINLVNDDTDTSDDNGHGTHLASVLVGQGPLVPLAPGATILPVKVLDSTLRGTELGLAEGIRFAVDAGADVINMSLAFPPSYVPSRFLQESIGYAAREGVTMVAAAGNEGLPVVSYPAAFREVIAVGASQIETLSPGQGPLWSNLSHSLELAPYSNRGPLLDLVAPGGSVDVDLSGDGVAEAILAQSYDPATQIFDYENRAGTSQATIQVSAEAAVLVSERGVRASRLRRLLGKGASRSESEPLGDDGQGYLNAYRSQHLGLGAITEDWPVFTTVGVAIESMGTGRRGVGRIQVLDGDGRPVHKAEVFASFTGSVIESVRGETDKEGRLIVSSSVIPGGEIIGLQVDAVILEGQGQRVERPRGAVRIDSCSLDRLVRFGQMTSSSSGTTSGTGIGTTPSAPLSVVGSLTPETVSSTLMNFSWLLSSMPMAVAVEDSWWQTAYPEAESVQIVDTGDGSQLVFSAQAFPQIVDGDQSECIDLVVRTFGEGLPLAEHVPLIADPAGDCEADGVNAVLRDVWRSQVLGQPLPTWSPDLGVDAEEFAMLTDLVVRYQSFAASPISVPVSELPGVMEVWGQSPFYP